MSRILVVEDESHLAQGVRFNLEAEGHVVEIVDNGEAALDLLLIKRHPFDAVILDVMLPGKDGFNVASELRGAGVFVPVLMLTARGRPEDVLRGFESGADDYLPKPFHLSILLARMNSLLRRQEWQNGSAPAAKPAPDVFAFNGATIDFNALELRSEKKTIRLTSMEADLLRHLIKNRGQVVSRKSILEEVWGLHEDTDTRAIDNFIVRLRRYIEEDPSDPKLLLTVRGVGYKFVA